jgi:ATP-dependent exoDNAse (exonuclease V) alpha subunit
MNSANFLPLQSRWPQLFGYASVAEHYVTSEPDLAVIKLRCFGEALVGVLYRELNLRSESTDSFIERLNSPQFKEIVGQTVLQKLHAIRMLGNKAAHGKTMDVNCSLALLEDAYLIGQWFYKTYSGDSLHEYPPYAEPKRKPAQSGENLAEQLSATKEELIRLAATEKSAQEKIRSLNQNLDETKLQSFKNSSIRATGSIDFKAENTRRLISIHDAYAGYKLTDEQAELVERLDRFLGSTTESAFLLKGYAGTGKTFITKGLTEYFRAIGRNYVLAAPTGKASKVIASKTKSPAYTIHKTIYSFDDIVEYRDDEVDGTETYKFYANLAVNMLSADTVFIVDEASMLADIYQEAEFFRFGTGYLLTDFLKYVNLDHNDHRKKVIFIGDDAQLPPVGMNFSPALDSNYLYEKHHVSSTGFELSEVVRQKSESGVIATAFPLRKALKENVFNRLTANFDYPDVKQVEHQELMERYLESCGNKINGESIVIAHSNSDVADYNQKIREHFFPGCTELTAGDKVMAISNSDAAGIFISNGDVGSILEVLSDAERRQITLRRKVYGKVEETIVPLQFRDVVVSFADLDGTVHAFKAKILEDLLYSKEPKLSSDQNKALYLDFCIRNDGLKRKSVEFKHALKSDPYFNALKLKFGYAITCHKAQGSEWNHVFVKCKSNHSQLSADYFRWFYTAITRTAKNLYLLDPPNLEPWDNIKVVPNPAVAILLENSATKIAPVVVADVQPPLAVVPESMDTHGIPPTAQFLLALLAEIRKLVIEKGVAIESIAHHQYKETYHFNHDGEHCPINIDYDSKDKVKNISASQLSQLGAELVALLSPLKGRLLFVSDANAVREVRFEMPFLNEFHQRVVGLCHERGIAVQKVAELQWALRYFFTRESEVAVYDISYNGKGQFRSCQPIVTSCTPGELVRDVALMLTDGLSK